MGIRLIIATSEHVNPPDEVIDQAVRDLMVEHKLEDVAPTDPPERVASQITEVVAGCAVGMRWAAARGIAVHREVITDEDVHAFGKFCARQQRNRRMAERGAACVAFWDGMSQGTPDLVTRMAARRKPVNVVPFRRAPGRKQSKGQRKPGDAG